MSRKRQHQQSEEVRNRILDIARHIISEEGTDALSIRRITKEMDYSAGIVYYYFESKEQILSYVLMEGYKRILNSVKPLSCELPPDEAIRASFTGYIESAMKWPEEYKSIMLGSTPQILDFTSVLGEEICEKRPALMGLVKTIKAGISMGLFAPCDAHLTAQSLWCAVFGLLMRMIIEHDISPERQSKLIKRQIDILLKGLSL